ncbi:hypothetical protein ACF09H_06955 [Streptomyces sp. NPDC014983]|uniref:hypothetical protein n=1 Tax=Streptomyces sp. NPDC014983 TaxID=3364933 RepID=UPI0036F858FB
MLAAFNHATGPLRAKDVCEALGHEPLPKNVEGTRAKLKRLDRPLNAPSVVHFGPRVVFTTK